MPLRLRLFPCRRPALPLELLTLLTSRTDHVLLQLRVGVTRLIHSPLRPAAYPTRPLSNNRTIPTRQQARITTTTLTNSCRYVMARCSSV